MRENGFTLIELLMATVILVVLVAIAMPNYLRAQKQAQESEVKTVAHALQMAVEDYKTTPGWEGLKPSNSQELNYAITTFMPSSVRSKRNPFNQAEVYILGMGIMFGPPISIGRVGYQYTSQVMAYTISSEGGDAGVIILTLVEGQ